MANLVMPSLGSDMEAGTLVEWLIRPGDVVTRGDVVAVVETQKGAIEIESFLAGTVQDLVAEVGQKLPVGQVMARIGGAAEEDAVQPVANTHEPPAEQPVAPISVAKPVPVTSDRDVRASPAARRAAQAAGIPIASIRGSGPDGAVQIADVETAIRRKEPDRHAPLKDISGMRDAIAAAMSRSNREIPHFHVSHSIETQAISDWLTSYNADRTAADRLLIGAVFVKAAALAAKAVGSLNGHFTDGQFAASEAVHVGIAISLRGGGLVAPAIKDTDEKSIAQVMANMRDLVSRARAGRLRSSEFTRATITLSSLGDGGAEAMSGVIFPPQVALLTAGSPQVRPWVTQGRIEPRQVTRFALSADHRVNNGRQASRFLIVLQDKLSEPEAL